MKALMVLLTTIISLFLLQAKAQNQCLNPNDYNNIRDVSAAISGSRSPASESTPSVPAEGVDPNLSSELGGGPGNTRVGNTVLGDSLNDVNSVSSIDNGSTYLGSSRSTAATPDSSSDANKPKKKKQQGVGQAN